MQQKFSTIIQGCMNWGAWGKQLSKNEMISSINHCMENGITAFDHADILAEGLARLRGKLRYRPIGFELLPKKFSLSQLQHLYEVVL